MKYTGTVARRIVTPTEYRDARVLLAYKDPDHGEVIEVFSLDGDALGVSQAREGVRRLLATMTATEVLAYLYERNSVATTYSEPRVVSAGNPELAAAKLYESE